MLRKLFVSFISLLILLSFTLFAQENEKEFLYVGVDKCKICHMSSKIGKQYPIWKEGPHANALESLSSEKSMKFAKENGIEDPTKADQCLNCHATMATVDKNLIDPKGKLSMEEGVSCESCHGPGSEYRKMSIMKDHEKSLANGLVLPTEEVCVTCHNEDNPFHKPFNYEEAVTKIQHPIPEKE
ncbi:MAG: cytochrome C554 [Caldithrix sp.]|nr:cytochrome C554 [Caldithrix sp.]